MQTDANIYYGENLTKFNIGVVLKAENESDLYDWLKKIEEICEDFEHELTIKERKE